MVGRLVNTCCCSSLITFFASLVPEAPKIVKAIPSGPYSAMISWSVPSNPNGHLVGYTVYWAEKKNVARAFSRYVEAPQTHLTLNELSISSYQVRIQPILVKNSQLRTCRTAYFFRFGSLRPRASEKDPKVQLQKWKSPLPGTVREEEFSVFFYYWIWIYANQTTFPLSRGEYIYTYLESQKNKPSNFLLPKYWKVKSIKWLWHANSENIFSVFKTSIKSAFFSRTIKGFFFLPPSLSSPLILFPYSLLQRNQAYGL